MAIRLTDEDGTTEIAETYAEHGFEFADDGEVHLCEDEGEARQIATIAEGKIKERRVFVGAWTEVE